VSPCTNAGLSKVNRSSFQQTFQPHHICLSPSDFNQNHNEFCMFTAYRDTSTMVWEDQARLGLKSRTALFYLHAPQNLRVNTIPSVSLLCFPQRQFLIAVIYLLW